MSDGHSTPLLLENVSLGVRPVLLPAAGEQAGAGGWLCGHAAEASVTTSAAASMVRTESISDGMRSEYGSSDGYFSGSKFRRLQVRSYFNSVRERALGRVATGQQRKSYEGRQSLTRV